MSAKDPVIKFSPFEALLIGEKNNILKRQPMKNTIFVTRLNQRSKDINLRDLFGLENSTKTEKNDVIFKMPQRVHDFLKNRKLENKTNKITKSKMDEILCYEFEGCTMITKNSETHIPNAKNLIMRLNKVKFKQKFKYKGNIRHKVMKKFPSPTRKKNYHEIKGKSIIKKKKNKNKDFNVKRHSLRGKDGKFICKKDGQTLKSQEISPKQKYLSNYLHQLYLEKKKKIVINAQTLGIENSQASEIQHPVKSVVDLPYTYVQFDISASEAILNEVLSMKYYESNCHEDFQFPKFPKELQQLDFEKDCNLVDIIFENFPEIIKFECQGEESDFSSALFTSGILKHPENIRMYEKKKNGHIKVDKGLKKPLPVIKLSRINEIMPIMPNIYPIRNGKNMYTSKIDEPYTRKSHLITGKTCGSFFFQSAEGKDIFIGNLIKPFFQNSWFGSLPES